MEQINELSEFAENLFLNRADMQQALKTLYAPIEPYFSPGSAQMSLGVSGATFLVESAELEGFARPLWGIIPLADGFATWELFQEEIRNGTNPDHEEFWGFTQEKDQRLVELADFGYALSTSKLIPLSSPNDR